MTAATSHVTTDIDVGWYLIPFAFGNFAGAPILGHFFEFGAALMIVGGIVEIVLGIDAERTSLEDVAAPLTLAA